MQLSRQPLEESLDHDDVWRRYEIAKREIAATAQSAEEYERRVAEVVEALGL